VKIADFGMANLQVPTKMLETSCGFESIPVTLSLDHLIMQVLKLLRETNMMAQFRMSGAVESFCLLS
jgi:hypothetical protein